MPVIKVDMWAGRPASTKKKLISELTAAASSALGCPAAAVTVIITEVPKENWGEEGKQASDSVS